MTQRETEPKRSREFSQGEEGREWEIKKVEGLFYLGPGKGEEEEGKGGKAEEGAGQFVLEHVLSRTETNQSPC
jgi:hypothetical protein